MPQAPIYEKKNKYLALLAPKVLLLWLWFIIFQLNEKTRKNKKTQYKIIPATNPNRIVKTHRYKELLEWGSIIHLTLRLGPMGISGPHGPTILYYIILYYMLSGGGGREAKTRRNKPEIITVLFAIWRTKKCKNAYIYCAFCYLENNKVQISLYLPCFLQFGELKSANKRIFTVLFAIRRAKKCKISLYYCAFCNLES